MKTQWLIISALAFALVTAIFAVINVETVQVNFLFAKATTPLIVVILAATLLGGVIVGLFGFIRQFRLQRQVRHLERELAALQNPETGPQEAAPSPDVESAGQSGRNG